VEVADKIASEHLVERPIDWGVDTVFGLAGDGINEIMEGLRRHQDRICFVLVHHAIVHVPPQIPALVDRAVRTSLAHRTVSHLTFPNDFQFADASRALRAPAAAGAQGWGWS